MSRLLHVNINAKDWDHLASFYEKVFGCVRVSDKKITGSYASDLTGVSEVTIEGVAMEFPDDLGGMQLEIFQYNHWNGEEVLPINATGIGHIAIDVKNINQVTQRLIDCGGSYIGQQIHRTYDDKPDLFIHYVADCEGNIIELMETKEA